MQMQRVTQILNFAGIRNAFFGLLVSMAATWTIASSSFLLAQNEAASTTVGLASVPRLIRFNGTLIDGRGWPITTPVNVLFAIYSQPEGEGEPFWQETQQITPNDKGGYSVLLGSANPAGMAIEVFKPGESQYLSIKPEGEPEQRRVLLVSVPYALKAADSATLGGLPPSAFVLAGANASTAAAIASTISPNGNHNRRDGRQAGEVLRLKHDRQLDSLRQRHRGWHRDKHSNGNARREWHHDCYR
jgi:hypothetical protein